MKVTATTLRSFPNSAPPPRLVRSGGNFLPNQPTSSPARNISSVTAAPRTALTRATWFATRRRCGNYFCRRLRSEKLSADPPDVLACAKHFTGDGGTTNGIDQGKMVCDEATLRKLFLPPY